MKREIEIAKDSGNEIVAETFEKLWRDRGYARTNLPTLHSTGNGFIATAPREFQGKVWNKIYYLAVDKKHRRKGIAKELLEDISGPYLYVTEQSNKAAVKLCHSLKLTLAHKEINEFDGTDLYFVKELTYDEVASDIIKHSLVHTKVASLASKYMRDPSAISNIVRGIKAATPNTDTTKDNGGPTNYYDFEPSWVGAGDIIEGREMNFNQGSILKAAFCFNIGRHSATTYERELNKIVYFAQRELKRCR